MLDVISRVMAQLQQSGSTTKHSRTFVEAKALKAKEDQLVRDVLKFENIDAKAETKQLRESLGQLENELRTCSEKITLMDSAHALILERCSSSLACGWMKFVKIRGSSMSKTSHRFFCLGIDTAEIFDANNIAVEHSIKYTDYITRAVSLNGELTIEFSYRRDTLTFRIKTPASDKNKWRWAYDRLFGGIHRERTSLHSDTSYRGLRKVESKSSDYSDSDEESFVGSLSSLASEVRLGLPVTGGSRDQSTPNVPTIYKLPKR
jgi:hypothetical protein